MDNRIMVALDNSATVKNKQYGIKLCENNLQQMHDFRKRIVNSRSFNKGKI